MTDKSFLIQLTNMLYRLTLLFPKKEPLRYKMRELADEILARPGEKDLEILDCFFEVAKNQNWASPNEILKIQEDYSKLKEELKSFAKSAEFGVPKIEREHSVSSAAGRQEKILEILKERGRAQVGELRKTFPQVSKRTIRRDFEFLLHQGAVERLGERNDTFYKLKTIES